MITLVCFGVTVFLGFWQLHRLEWKTGLIANIENSLKSEAREYKAKQQYDGEFIKVVTRGIYDHEKELHFGSYYADEWGYKLVTPLQMEDGNTVYINRGWVPQKFKTHKNIKVRRPKGNVEVVGLIRKANLKSWFTPTNDSKKNYWFWYDIEAMNKFTGFVGQNLVIEEIRNSGQGEGNVKAANDFPLAIEPEVKLRNDHLQYAVTWFGMSLAIIVIFLVDSRKRVLS